MAAASREKNCSSPASPAIASTSASLSANSVATFTVVRCRRGASNRRNTASRASISSSVAMTSLSTRRTRVRDGSMRRAAQPRPA